MFEKNKTFFNKYKIFFDIILWVIKAFAIIFFPFFLFVRGAVYFYMEQHFFTYIALGTSYLLTLLLLLAYLTLITYKVFGRAAVTKKVLFGKSLLVGGILLIYCLFSLFYLGEKNTKSSQVQNEFTSLHPIMRIGISTILIFDRKLVITDLARVPKDYKKMGLKTKNRSMHYKQKDGYTHAIDIRTNNRTWFRNGLIKLSLWAMGFKTLRHVGTGDHLHVSLPLPDNPNTL